MMPSDSDPRLRLIGLVATRAAPTREQWRRRARRLLLGAGAWAAGIALVMFRVPADGRWLWTIGSVAGFGILLALSGFYAFSYGRSALGRSRVWMLVVALITMLAPMAGAWWSGQLPGYASDALPFRTHIGCLLASLGIGLGPFIAFLLVKLGSDYVRPRVTGMLIGGMAGAVGGLGISLHCAERVPVHLMLGHALPLIVLGVVGWALGNQVVGGRRA